MPRAMGLNNPLFLKNRLSTLTKSVFLCSATLLSCSLLAEIPWRNKRYSHFSQGEELRSLLKGFIAEQGINAVVSEEINGLVSGNFNNLSPQTFFEGMMSANSLIWFYDGTNLYIDPSSEVRTQALQLPYVSAERLIEAAKEMHYESSSWSISRIPKSDIVQLSGPNRLVARLGELAMALDTGQNEKDSIRVFPLKYAWAQDTNVAYQGQTVTVPGVATQLQQLMFGQSENSGLGISSSSFGGSLSTPQKTASTVTPLTPLSGQGGIPDANPSNSDSQNNSSSNKATKSSGAPSPSANIQSNIQLNAIVIRDSIGRMPLYEDVINMLDRPVPIIEITVSIVDVDTQFTSQLGNQLFNISKTGGKTNFSIGAAPAGGTATASLGGDSSSVTLLDGVSPNLAMGAGFSGAVSTYKFAEAIQALEANNRAQTLSRPSVLTLDNTEAVISQQSTFYTQTSAQYSSTLYNVNSGTLLRVTPHLIQEEGQLKVKLLVNIQDGSTDFATLVNSLPTVSENTVTTQAVIQEGQSLLVAGHFTKRDEQNRTGIPILSQIPIVGFLFGAKNKTFSTAERLYLITPKLIDINEVPQEPYQQFFQDPVTTEKMQFNSVPESYAIQSAAVDTAS